MYKIVVRSRARKQLKKLSPDIQQRIISKLDYYSQVETPLFFAERLTDFSLGQYRFRVGDYRIIFDVVEDAIVIHKVGHRREIYK